MAWRPFEEKWGKGRFEVSLTPSGKVGVSRTVYEKWLRGCKGVILAYDDERRRIGIKPAFEPYANMYSLTPARKDGRGGFYIAAVAFFKQHKIPLPQKPVRKVAYKEDDFVVIDLD